MSRPWLLLVTALLVTLASVALSRNEVLTNYPQVVKLLKDGKAVCTGVVVKKDFVATAGHCATKNTKISVKFSDKPARIFKVWKTVDNRQTYEDWALLKGDTGNVKPWPLAENPPRMPYPTYFVTFGPEDQRQKAIPCFLTHFIVRKGKLTLAGIGVVVRGDSGSALLDFNQNVIGILTGFRGDYGAWVTPSFYLLQALK